MRVHDGDAEVGDEELREDLVERLLVMLLRVPRLKEGGQQAGGGGLQAGGVGLQAGGVGLQAGGVGGKGVVQSALTCRDKMCRARGVG